MLRELGIVVREQRVQPSGALYVSLAPRYTKVDHPALVSSRDLLQQGTARPRGILNGQYLDALEPATPKGRLAHYNVFRKKGGELGDRDRSDAVDHDSFHAVLDFVKEKIARMAAELLDGQAAVRPYRFRGDSPCKWCSMIPVCRFEMGLSEVRFLESMPWSEFYRRIRETGP